MNSKPYLVTAGTVCLLTIGTMGWAADSDRAGATPLQLAADTDRGSQGTMGEPQPRKKSEQTGTPGQLPRDGNGADSTKQNGGSMDQDKPAKDKKAKVKRKAKPEKQQQQMPNSDTGAPSGAGGSSKPAQ